MAVNILYTNTDAIRSAVGLDDSDVEDSIITAQHMKEQMTLALAKFLPTHEDDAYDPEIKVVMTLWCMWFGALRLAESPLATPKQFGNGKDDLQRFDVDWEALRALARKKLTELEEELAPTVVAGSFSFMGKATPAYNPVTG